MRETLSNVDCKIGLTVAPCTNLSNYAVRFGVDKAQLMTAALLALAAAMACDRNNCTQIRTRHPDFAQLCERICIETDNDCIENTLQKNEDEEESKFGVIV